MKNWTKRLFCCLSFLISNLSLVAFGDKTTFMCRSQAVNLPLQLAGWQEFTHQFDVQKTYGTVSLAIQYGRSFDNQNIAEFLLGGRCLRFSGSQAYDRSENDVMADYFGLPMDYRSIVYLTPSISNTVFDLNWYMGLDGWASGFYFSIHLPIVASAWKLSPQEYVIDSGSDFFPAGYMGDERIDRSDLPATVLDAWLGTTTFGDMQEPLEFGIVTERQSETQVAEMQLNLGWDFLESDWYHFGLYLRGTIPTGNRPNPHNFFAPVIGNGKHGAFGGGISAHAILWTHNVCDRAVGIYIEAIVEHLFPARQNRSFDFNNGPGSRFMLLAEIEKQVFDDLYYDTQLTTLQYTGRLIPAINQTTFSSVIAVSVQTDIALKLSYQSDQWEFDLGYNFWARSHEKLCKRDHFQENEFALKGDAQIYGFLEPDDTAILLSSSQHEATIHGGQGTGNPDFVNNNADNPELAKTNLGADQLVNLTSADATELVIAIESISSSNQPILLSDKDINNDSAVLPRGLSNKFFVYLGKYIPFCSEDDLKKICIGVGASVESAPTSSFKNSANSQWAAWMRVGIAF